ncbi:torsin-1A-interacting protein 2-like [Brachionichthys hirsutus]|uniref:torsin-1A-interacting protein 2-like n=1 Tax=Brachionichthys hirsutus TaxID=412623 RepID=UPI003604D658
MCETHAKEGETPLTNMDHVSASDENALQRTDGDNPEVQTDNSKSCSEKNEDKEQAGFKYRDSAEKMVRLKEASSSPNETSSRTIMDNSSLPQAEAGSHGDHNSVTARDVKLTAKEKSSSEASVQQSGDVPQILKKSGDSHIGENRASKTSAADQNNPTNDQRDGPSAGNKDKPTNINNTDPHAADDDESSLDTQEKTSSWETSDEEGNEVETIRPTTQETPEPAVPVDTGKPGGIGGCLLAVGVVVVVVVAILLQHLRQPGFQPQEENACQIDIFLKQMEKLKTQFPNQRSEFWIRSRIHLLKHLQCAQPTEPVSLILTSGVRAESTLSCLARGLASAFSSSFNGSVLHIDGAGKASQDSDQVKLDIDSKLQGAFEGDKPVAVIHRFEELPPGSTLIFYRYCDHENAAFKKTFLIFTVLLEEEEIPAESRLSTVEEMVDDHLRKKFLSDGHPVSFDSMDLDKYGGLWSRISHLILPVTSEERMKHEECKGE